jgi:hypothetical protein
MERILAWPPGEDQGMRAANPVLVITLKDPELTLAVYEYDWRTVQAFILRKLDGWSALAQAWFRDFPLPPPDRALK